MLKKDLIYQIMQLIDHFLQEKDKKVTGLMKDELAGKFMTKIVGIRPKTYTYLIGDGNNDKKAKGTKKCVIKRMLKFNDYKNCLLKSKI